MLMDVFILLLLINVLNMKFEIEIYMRILLNLVKFCNSYLSRDLLLNRFGKKEEFAKKNSKVFKGREPSRLFPSL